MIYVATRVVVDIVFASGAVVGTILGSGRCA
jgi:hypothetical protein